MFVFIINMFLLITGIVTGSIVMLFTIMSLLIAAKRGDEQMKMIMEEKA